MGERGVKFVKPELPEWKWTRIADGQTGVPGSKSRHERRREAVELRQELKIAAKRTARRKARDAKNAAEELYLSGN